ncbi:HlyD family secretion protein [Sulfurimonas sp. NW7]|uniref:HlyD family secretion protein n=1 Tax=Sulfurimonas sp. NW7 TaxID=2922727 RepID=UPI003DA83716
MKKYKSLELVEPHKFIKHWMLITFSIISIFIILLFLPWQQTVFGIGKVIALNPTEREYNIVATVDGVIEKFYVQENQEVKKGELLFSMRDLDKDYLQRLQDIQQQTQNQISNLAIKLENLKNNLTNQKENLENKMKAFTTKISQQRNKILALQEKKTALTNQEKIAYINFKRTQKLFQDGIESKRALEVQNNAYISTKAELSIINTKIENAYKEISVLQNEKDAIFNTLTQKINTIKNRLLETKNSINTLKKNLQNESVKLLRYENKDIKAKSDGYVVRIYQNDTNKLLKKGEKILFFVPKVTTRAIRLEVSNFNMPLIKKGLEARIIFYGWPALQISGWPKISHGTYGGKIATTEQTAYDQNNYYALVVENEKDSKWPPSHLLRNGTQAKIWVRLSTVPIWYEIWRLISAQPPKMVHVKIDESSF